MCGSPAMATLNRWTRLSRTPVCSRQRRIPIVYQSGSSPRRIRDEKRVSGLRFSRQGSALSAPRIPKIRDQGFDPGTRRPNILPRQAAAPQLETKSWRCFASMLRAGHAEGRELPSARRGPLGRIGRRRTRDSTPCGHGFSCSHRQWVDLRMQHEGVYRMSNRRAFRTSSDESRPR